MFYVNDKQQERHDFVLSHLTEQAASIAIILASIDFEWTLRRAILAMGKSPTKVIRKSAFVTLQGGYMAYKDLWRAEVQPRTGLRIDQAITNWSSLCGSNGAASVRGSIVHGASVPITVDRARVHVENWLSASRALEKLALKIERRSLFRRIVRRKAR